MINKYEFQSRLDKFDLLAADTQEQLTEILSLLSSRKIPSIGEINALDEKFEALRTNYDDAVAWAKEQLHDEELPTDGSGLDEYAEAVEKSSAMIIRQRIKKAGIILTRFTRIRSKVLEYALALKPYQDKATALIQKLSEETIDDINTATEASEVLLNAIDAEDIHSQKGLALLNELPKHYSQQVQWGVAGNKYYVDDTEYESIPSESKDSFKEDVIPIDGASNPEARELEGIADTAETKGAVITETDGSENNNEVTDDSEKMFNANIEKLEIKPFVASDEDGNYDILNPINKIKTGAPSASSFKKEIKELARVNPIISFVIPLLTKFGILTKEQVSLFANCVFKIKDENKFRDGIEKSIDVLVQKGYLACYQFDMDNDKKEAFCLTSYCYNCLKKETISSQMKKFWRFPFGEYPNFSTEKIRLTELRDTISKIEVLLRYLDFEKKTMNKEEMYNMVKSIRFKNGHYHVPVIDSGKKYDCIVIAGEPEIIDIEATEVLLGCEEGIIPETISTSVNTLFLVSSNGLEKYDCIEGKLQLTQNESVEIKEHIEINTTPDDVILDESRSNQNEAVHSSEDVQAIDSQGKINDTTDVNINVESTITDNTEIESITEGSDLHELLEMKDAPSDEDFCSIIETLINRPSKTKEDLTSVIVQSILFANGASLEEGRPQASKLASQLKLATHLLLGDNNPYSAENLISTFANPAEENRALLLSAYLLAMLNPSIAYDYALKEQTKKFFDDYDIYFNGFEAFKPLFNKMMSVQGIHTQGYSPAVIAHIGNKVEKEAFIDKLKIDAKKYLTPPFPKTHMKSLPTLYSNCFGEKSDLYQCMMIIAEDKQDQNSIEYLEAVLENYCTFNDNTFTLDSNKVEEKLATEWDELNQKKPFKLEYEAHDRAIRHFNMRLRIMLNWNEQISNLNNQEQKIFRLSDLKQKILTYCDEIQNDETWKGENYSNILSWNLFYMRSYLTGEYSKLNTYSELLSTGIISVMDDGSPDIDPSTARINYYEPWRNALRHILAEKRKLEDVKSEIIGDNIYSDDEEAGLKDNLHQLTMIGKIAGSNNEDYVITDTQIKEATVSADVRTDHFKEALELAYTYNQINEIEKETLSGIMTQYKNYFYTLMDFANWRRFLEALEKQIKDYATGRKVTLRTKLDSRFENNPDSTLLKEADRLLEEEMNLAVTEEYLNRYDSGEKEIDDAVELILHDNDYFEDFLNPDKYDKIFNVCKNNHGNAVKNFGAEYLSLNFPRDWTSRLRDDSIKMIKNWPTRKGNSTTPMHIKTLFMCLGLNVQEAYRVNNQSKFEMYQITVEPTPKSMSDYNHPIAAFGTQMKSPIDVIVLYGNHTEKEVVDTITSLNLGGISFVLVDQPFDISSRRQVGEIFHKHTSGQNPFLLIDQVLILYLAMHQSTERLPALLKCTLPFTTYQPFVRDGGSTSDEMFFGRTQELATIIDLNGACVVYGGRQLGKTALLERVESRCSKPKNKTYAVYSSIIKIKDEKEVVSTLISDIEKKTNGCIKFSKCATLKEMCNHLSKMFINGDIVSMHLLIDEVDDFLGAIADQSYRQLQPLVDLRRETRNQFKFVIAGLHNVCRAKNATRENGLFGQLGMPLCIKPLSPNDALKLFSRPLSFLGFKIDRYTHLETILTNTNYYPGILQFFGYILVETLTKNYNKYYRAADGNPPFSLQDEQLGSVMNSSDLNKSIKEKFRLSLELDPRYSMIARCITMLYHYYEVDRSSGSWLGFKVEDIINLTKEYKIKCLENATMEDYINLLDEMEEMGILSQPKTRLYRLRRSSFVNIIGENIDVLEQDIINNNKEA